MFYDYHGECDLVLIKNDDINLHIRTKPQGGYASISHAALEIGGEILEINDDGKVFLDKVHQTTPSSVNSVGGYPLTFTAPIFYGSYERYQVDISDTEFVRITKYQWSNNVTGLDIVVQGAEGDLFSGSQGLCGSWDSGGGLLEDRLGNSLLVGSTDWHKEWQVTTSEDLFAGGHSSNCTASNACSGENADGKTGCIKKVEIRDHAAVGKVLQKQEGDVVGGGTRMLHDRAGPEFFLPPKCTRSCADIHEDYHEHRKNCDFDLNVTGNKDFACMPAYMDPIVAGRSVSKKKGKNKHKKDKKGSKGSKSSKF
jgi:hypothetical protein